MKYYVRMIRKDRWERTSPEDEISGEAITIDWGCVFNEWSVYECEAYLKKTDEIAKIVLRMVGDNPKKTADGIDLLYLDDSFFRSTGVISYPDPEKKLGSLHCNLREVNYGTLKKAVIYSLNNIKDHVLSYTPVEIKELFKNIGRNFIEEFKQEYKKDKLKAIIKYFFGDSTLEAVFNI